VAEDIRGKMPGDLPEVKAGVPKELSKKSLEEDVFIAKTFSTPSGRKTLEWLRNLYIEAPVAGYVVDRNGNINAAATTFQLYQKEGQRIVIKNIEMRVKRGQNPANPG